MHEEQKELVNYVFATHKKLKLGPGEYDSKYSQVKQRSQTSHLNNEPVEHTPASIKTRCFQELYILRGVIHCHLGGIAHA